MSLVTSSNLTIWQTLLSPLRRILLWADCIIQMISLSQCPWPFIPFARSLSPCKVPGMRVWTSLGCHSSVYHWPFHGLSTLNLGPQDPFAAVSWPIAVFRTPHNLWGGRLTFGLSSCFSWSSRAEWSSLSTSNFMGSWEVVMVCLKDCNQGREAVDHASFWRACFSKHEGNPNVGWLLLLAYLLSYNQVKWKGWYILNILIG